MGRPRRGKKTDEVDKIRSYNENQARKLVITIEIQKEEFYPCKVAEKEQGEKKYTRLRD